MKLLTETMANAVIEANQGMEEEVTPQESQEPGAEAAVDETDSAAETEEAAVNEAE